MEIWEPEPPGTLWATPGLLWDCLTPLFISTITMFSGEKHLVQAGTKIGPRETEVMTSWYATTCMEAAGYGRCRHLLIRDDTLH